MKTHEEIGRAVAQRYLFINNKRYEITEVKMNGKFSSFSILDEKGNYNGYIDVFNDKWYAEPKISDEDKIRIGMLRELDYRYLKVEENYTDISYDDTFEETYRVYCLNSLPKGIYKITEDGYYIHYLGGSYD